MPPRHRRKLPALKWAAIRFHAAAVARPVVPGTAPRPGSTLPTAGASRCTATSNLNCCRVRKDILGANRLSTLTHLFGHESGSALGVGGREVKFDTSPAKAVGAGG